MRILILLVVLVMPLVTVAKPRSSTPSLPAAFHNNQGASMMTRGRLPEAEFEFKTAIELSPNYAEAYNNLGLTYKMMNRLDEAIVNFKKATSLDPSYASAYNHLGSAYLAQGNTEEAIKAFRKAISKESNFADAYYNMGLAYLDQYRTSERKDTGKRDQAEILLKQATDLNPKLLDAHRVLAQIYTDKGEWEKASIRYRVALEQDPSNAENWNALGRVYQQLGDAAKAKSCFDAAKTAGAAPKAPAADNSALIAGIAAQKAGKESDALMIFFTILEKDPKNSDVQFRVGTIRLDQGERALKNKTTGSAKKLFAEAASHLQVAVETNPKLWDGYYNWGLALFQGGNADEALKIWQKLLTQNPAYLRAAYNVGMVEWQRGKLKEALPYLCRFVKEGSKEFADEVKAVQSEMARNTVTCPN